MKPKFRVFVDFDGTISPDDATDDLLKRFAEPGWVELEAQWIAGRIGSADCMERQVGLLRLRPETLHAFIGAVRIDPAFVGFARLAGRLGVPLAVVSDGLDLVIHGALKRVGLTLPVLANRLVYEGGERWSLRFPHGDADCGERAGHCKCRSLAAVAGRTVLIGDGRSDYCGARSADFVFAKDALLDHCRENAVACAPFRDFADLTPRFARFASGASAVAWPHAPDTVTAA